MPDTKPADSDLNWEAGAADNIFLHSVPLECPAPVISSLISDIITVAHKGGRLAKRRIQKTVNSCRAIHLVDPFTKILTEKLQEIPIHPHFQKFARELAFHSGERELVKFGISLLGAIGCDEEDIRRIKTLAKHEEFTLYAIVTLDSSLSNADLHIWELAQQTFGWGRINCIELLRNTKNKKIQKWLLTEGYRNTVMYEYTAYICATTGDLKDTLAADIIDDMLLENAYDILSALFRDGPTNGIDEYRDAPETCSSYVRHVGLKGKGLKHFAMILRILRYIENPLANRQSRKWWDARESAKLAAKIEVILKKPHWRKDILSEPYNEDLADEYLLAANYLGLDMWEANWNKLLSNPLNPSYWREIFRLLTPERTAQVAELMREAVPWVEMAAEASEDSYYHFAMDEILAGIRNFPKMGGDLLFLVLKSVMPRHRYAAAQVLTSWGNHNWPKGMTEAIQTAYDIEKNKETRLLLAKLLKLSQ